MTAAAAWREVDADRLGDGEGRDGEVAGSLLSLWLWFWVWLLEDDMPDPKAAAASLGDADDEEGDNGAGGAADGGGGCDGGGGGGERVEGGRELRSGMAGPPEPSFLVLAISQIWLAFAVQSFFVVRSSLMCDQSSATPGANLPLRITPAAVARCHLLSGVTECRMAAHGGVRRGVEWSLFGLGGWRGISLGHRGTASQAGPFLPVRTLTSLSLFRMLMAAVTFSATQVATVLARIRRF